MRTKANILPESIRLNLGLIVLASIVPILAVILLSGQERREHEIATARMDVQRVANSLAEQLQTVVQGTRQLLTTLALLPEVRNHDLEACSRTFQELLRVNTSHANITLLNPRGEVMASGLPLARANFADQKHVIEARRDLKFSVGEYLVGRISAVPIIAFAHPVLDPQGHLAGILTTSLKLDQFNQLFEKDSLPEGSNFSMMDHQGIRLSYYPPSERMPVGQPIRPTSWAEYCTDKKEGSSRHIGMDGIMRTWAFRQLRLQPDAPPYMVMVAAFPDSLILEKADMVTRKYLSWLTGAAFLSLLAAWIVGKHGIIRRLKTLGEVAARLGRGELEARTGLKESKGHLGMVAKAFDDMAANIEAREAARREAETALRESEQRFKHLFDNMADGVAIYQAVDDGRDFVFVDINRPGQAISKISREEAIGKRITEAFPGEELMGLLDVFRSVHITGEPQSCPLTLYRDERVEQWVENYVFKLPSGHVVALYSDTSEKHRAEKEREKLQLQLVQAQKMEAVGTLAGGVAHDFNNILQAIGGYTSLTLWDTKPEDPQFPNLKAIETATARAAQLVKQLLLFSRKVEAERRPIQLNEEIERGRGILERTIPKMIDMEFRAGGRLWPIKADPVQLEQILLNLGGNAADAMPEGGKLFVTTENITLGPEYTSDHLGATPGKYVLLTVSDTGQGMDQETIKHIFEPFFTTKEIGKGTGLGLASVYGIVKGHGGYITCYSEVGRGTTFKIYLPAIEAEDAVPDASSEEPSPRGGTETILLVDDDTSIRNFASLALQRFGYKVISTTNGEEALEAFGAQIDQIDLVLLDIGMPGMGGHRCLREILRLDPSAKIIIASGYSMNGQLKKTLEAGAAGYIGKPYQLQDLLDGIRAVLDGRIIGK